MPSFYWERRKLWKVYSPSRISALSQKGRTGEKNGGICEEGSFMSSGRKGGIRSFALV